MRRDIGLLHDPNRKPVKLNSLMSNFADQAGDFIGDSLHNIWRGLLDVDPELQARRDAEAKALYDRRAQSPAWQRPALGGLLRHDRPRFPRLG